MLSIEPVDPGRELRKFMNLDLQLYRRVPLYAPPVRLDVLQRLRRWTAVPKEGAKPKHAAALFLARQGNRPVGRIAASIDFVKNEHTSTPSAAFGFLEGEEDPEIFARLFEAAEAWIVEHGVHRVLGPYSFTQEDPYVGLLVDGFDVNPCFGMTYSLPWYPAMVEAAGYKPIMDLKSYIVRSGDIPAVIAERAEAAYATGRVRVRPIEMRRIWDEAKLLRNIFNSALRDNWEFVPFTDEQVHGMVQELKLLADPRLVLIAYVNDQPAGAVINIPDYNDVLRATSGKLFPLGIVRLLWAKRHLTRFRAYAMGVLQPYRRLGVAACLVYETFRRCVAAGYSQAEVTWILGDNGPMNELAKRFAENQGKTHRVYEKMLPLV
jgi:GNAT superfamily N-acetyltransferase